MKNKYDPDRLPIRAWAEEDRPREKLLTRGKQNLTEAELLAILLGSGNREESALGLAQRMLGALEQDLHRLSKCTIAELTRFRGIGQTKAVVIQAALELGRRRQLSRLRNKPTVRCSQDAFGVIAPLLQDLPHEEFWILLLNRANVVTAREQISIGGTAGTVVDGKIIFRKALEGRASAIILCHNHPSGALRPSQADREITEKLREAGRLLDLQVLDHLIISEQGYFSFADEGIL
ncbi:MAG: DNA repair protein RadC [Saprospiraceae bacterium]|nr:DNA repair protein RadC [Saprospiraceae bacterium]MCB0627081.1 DNA repair protein RadC [Saprospiraceae bacterium]MCB0681383.1 DNA repair protein RadC [Saprospiraceae bacterium]